jgi:integrase
MADYVRKRVVNGIPYWYASFVFPKDPITGKRPPAKDFSAKTRREAVAKRDQFADEFKRNPKADDKNTFGLYIASEFLAGELARVELPPDDKLHLSWSRYRDRKSRMDSFLLSKEAAQICATRIAELQPAQFAAYLKARSPQLSAYQYNKERQDLLLAVKGLYGRTRTPVSEFEFFFRRFIPPREEVPQPKAICDPDALLDKLENDAYPLEYRALVAFEFVANCRPQDLMPFEWADVDWERGTFKLDKRVCAVKGANDKTAYAVVRNTARAGKGTMRELPLGTFLGPLLHRLRLHRMKHGPASPYVFPHTDGTMLTKMRLRRLWLKIRETMELPEGKFYHLKHAGNSYAQAHGIPARVQADKMGHAPGSKMPVTTYREVFDSELVAAFNVFDRKRTG